MVYLLDIHCRTHTIEIGSRDAHNIHMCGTTMTCPAKCALCNRLCAEKNHFHALETNAIHLCG